MCKFTRTCYGLKSWQRMVHVGPSNCLLFILKTAKSLQFVHLVNLLSKCLNLIKNEENVNLGQGRVVKGAKQWVLSLLSWGVCQRGSRLDQHPWGHLDSGNGRDNPLIRGKQHCQKVYIFKNITNWYDTNDWKFSSPQGGRTWQLFVGSKNGNANFRQARIYNFHVKCVGFARNRKFAKLTQWNMQYIPCNSALLTQETLFLTQKGTFFAQRSPKSA